MAIPYEAPDAGEGADDCISAGPAWLGALLQSLSARAAGVWTCARDRLHLEAFVSADDLPKDVSRGFARSTLEVPLDRSGLGIVQAAVDRAVATSWASALPDDGGSGTWLRAFQAVRSVAVPILDAQGQTCRVIAIAIGPDCDLSSEEVARRLQTALPPG
jgi:hypothetical protein